MPDVREPKPSDHVMIATEPRRYGMLTGTVVGAFRRDDGVVAYAVVLDYPRNDGASLLFPVPGNRLVVLPT